MSRTVKAQSLSNVVLFQCLAIGLVVWKYLGWQLGGAAALFSTLPLSVLATWFMHRRGYTVINEE